MPTMALRSYMFLVVSHSFSLVFLNGNFCPMICSEQLITAPADSFCSQLSLVFVFVIANVLQ
uniref:Uncharacterized protein n=1 Tax=Arundo donax TaxID=35708 RepID=A0A0A9A8Q8_ARUDO